MRAMVYRGNRNLNLEVVPEPNAEEGEVKLEVDYCGICATDIEEYLYGPKDKPQSEKRGLEKYVDE